MGKSETPIAPKTILTLKREPICPLRRSAPRRTRLRVRIREKTSSAATIAVESAKKTTKVFPCCGRRGILREPSVNTAAASNTTTIPPIVSQRSLLRCRFTLTALFEVAPQRAFPTERVVRAAKVFPGFHNQGVKFVEPFRVPRKLAFEHPADIVVFRLVVGPSVARQHAPGVSVHDEDGVLARIQQDGIGGLRTNSEHAEQLFTQHDRGSLEHSLERAAVFDPQEFAEGFQLPRLLPKIPRRPNHSFQSPHRNFLYR